MCDAVFQSGWVFFTCPYCCLLLLPRSFFFFRDKRQMWNPEVVTNCIDSEPRFSVPDFVFGTESLGSRLGFT